MEIAHYIVVLKEQLISELGHVALDSITIDRVGKKWFKAKWQGCTNQSKFRSAPGYQIVNTSYSPNSRGVHWVAIYISPEGAVHVFDSFARNERHLLPIVNRVDPIADPVVGRRQFQKGSSPYCGHISLAWLRAVQRFGIDECKDI